MNGGVSKIASQRRYTYPECFMFWGLSIRTASLILRSWSGQFLETVILCHSDCLGLFGVGWRITCWKKNNHLSQKHCNGHVFIDEQLCCWEMNVLSRSHSQREGSYMKYSSGHWTQIQSTAYQSWPHPAKWLGLRTEVMLSCSLPLSP